MFTAFLFGMLLGPEIALGQDIVAHRGASHDAPENTLAAFREAWDQHADAIEGDFHLTRDGHIVCIHDARTKRYSEIDLVVADATLEELRRLDVGAWKGKAFAGERIPTLEEVLAQLKCGQYLLLEIKSGPELVPVLKRTLDRTNLPPGRVKVIAFDEEVIAETRRQIPAVETFWLTSYKKNEETSEWSPSLTSVLDTLERIDAHGLDTHANRQVVDEAFAASLRQAGHALHVWTVNGADDARYFQALGVDSITTDRPGMLREALSLNVNTRRSRNKTEPVPAIKLSKQNCPAESPQRTGDENLIERAVFALDVANVCD